MGTLASSTNTTDFLNIFEEKNVSFKISIKHSAYIIPHSAQLKLLGTPQATKYQHKQSKQTTKEANGI